LCFMNINTTNSLHLPNKTVRRAYIKEMKD
jgi:hypothetical protein